MLLFKKTNTGKIQIAFPVKAAKAESLNIAISYFPSQRKFADT